MTDASQSMMTLIAVPMALDILGLTILVITLSKPPTCFVYPIRPWLPRIRHRLRAPPLGPLAPGLITGALGVLEVPRDLLHQWVVQHGGNTRQTGMRLLSM